jgi:hypothetical protein
VLGDGRLQIQKAPEAAYDLLFMDAFTSDAVPVHLMTREAVEMYKTKLAPGGIIIINIANRYLDFRSVLANLADSAGLQVLLGSADDKRRYGMFASAWILLARDRRDFGNLPEITQRWEEVKRDKKLGVWTDDFSNLLSVYMWR